MKKANKETKQIPMAEITAEVDGTFSAALFDRTAGKVWSGWANTRNEAVDKIKEQCRQLTGSDTVNIFDK